MKLLFDCHCQNFHLCRHNGSPILQPNYLILQPNGLSFAFIPRERSEWAGNVIPETKRGDNSQLSYRNSIVQSSPLMLSWSFHRLLGPEVGTSLLEANGDVPLDGIAFSRLAWLSWGRIFNRVTRIGSHIFWLLGTVLHIYRLANVKDCLLCEWQC